MKAYRLFMLTVTFVLIVNCMVFESWAEQVAGATKEIESTGEMTQFGIFRALQKPQETTFLSIATEESVIAMNNWDLIKKEFTCIVTALKAKAQHSRIPTFQLSFYENSKNKLVKKYVYETMASFLSLYPLGEAGGNLVTIWIGGSGYQFVVFSISEGEIKIVFDDGSSSMPEFIDIDNDGDYEILITQGAFRINYKTKEVITLPEARDVYKWNGDTYVKIKSIPWQNKLLPLQNGK